MKSVLISLILAGALCAQETSRSREVQRVREKVRQAAGDAIAAEAARASTEVAVQVAAEAARASTEVSVRVAADVARAAAQAALQAPARHWNEEGIYRRGTSALDDREWAKAVQAFDEVVRNKGVRADGALYWKAYALNKLGRRDEALAALAEIQQSHASSRWLNDAKVLDLEVRQSTGQPVSPEQESSDELKLYALASLVHTEPDRALPLLEKTLASASSPKLKERSLFVLAQISTPQARDLLVRSAFGGNVNPDLQRKAIQYLGDTRSKELSQKLGELYSSSSDVALKRSILHAHMRARDKERLLAVATAETDKNLRNEAIHFLSSAGGQDDLWKMYSTANDEVKLEILRSMHDHAAMEKLQEVARQERDPKLRREAVRMLGRHKTPQVAEQLTAIYSAESDKNIRKAAADGLYNQRNAKALVDLARKESDLEMKKYLVQRLANVKSKEASDYLMELLK